MKNQNAIKQTRSFELRPASVEEAGLFYSDEGQDPTLGTVGHLRMDFGSGGKGFYHTWWPHNGDHFNTPEFKEALQEFVDAMRQSGPLKDLSAMNTYCWRNGGEISDNDRVYFSTVYADPDLSAKAKQVLVYLHDRANKDGESWYAINTMAKDLSLSRSTIKRALAELVRQGRIKKQARFRENGGSSSNWYSTKR